MLGRGQHERRTDGRVSGKGQLRAGSEDSQPTCVGWVVGRQHKDGFREIELSGQGLHLTGIEPASVQDHGQRVAPESAAMRAWLEQAQDLPATQDQTAGRWSTR